jgi:hypothetical protein
MNFNLKNILKFNHIKGEIVFTQNKLQDLLIAPTLADVYIFIIIVLLFNIM